MQRMHIRAKKLSNIAICIMIISMEYKDIKGALVWISPKDSSVAPFSLFISFSLFLFFCIFLWPQWLFLFNSHFSSLGSFNVSTLGSFPHLRATLYFTRRLRRSFTLYKVLEIIKKM